MAFINYTTLFLKTSASWLFKSMSDVVQQPKAKNVKPNQETTKSVKQTYAL